MAVADGAGFPVAISVGSASPHEVRLVEETLEKRLVEAKPERLIGDKAYDSDPLDLRLAEQGIPNIPGDSFLMICTKPPKLDNNEQEAINI
jgi:hypothetical protein